MSSRPRPHSERIATIGRPATRTPRMASFSLPLLSALMATMSCKNNADDISGKTAWSYDKNVGVAVVTADRACLAIRNSSVPVNARAHVIDTQQQRDVPAVVVEARAACANNLPGMNGYQLR